MNLRYLNVISLLLAAGTLTAGTLVYKTGKNENEKIVSDVEIVSMDLKNITIKRGKSQKTIPRHWVRKYFSSDIKGAGQFEDNTSDYTVTITNVKVPLKGCIKVKNSKSKKKSIQTSEFEVEFTVSRKYEKHKSKAMKMPYIYLHILTTRSKSYGKHPVYTYCYPKEAKIRSKTYDEAKIMEKVNEIDRPNIWNNSAFKGYLGSGNSQRPGKVGGRCARIPLKGIKDKTILAYHIEIWGKNRIVATKDWSKAGYKPGNSWWKHY
ncbi:hypothetical protein P0136_06765 [Lentisphaerota bacterium ZTH]|nr:hypothetical protein JYG24_02125 [Lentisphaerota bacterium]WET07691.1 hypothetical protein P0136_06765 [Lentisphaerota bacterium ZTH]